MTWLVTGGAGFIGVNLLRLLAARRVRVRVLDSLVVGRREDLDGLGAELVEGDIRNMDVVRRALEGIDVVVHLAAHTRVMDSLADPRENFDVNAVGTLNLLEACRQRGSIKRFILASTGGAILGDAEPPVHEDMPARPLSPYGASKLACEGYCSAYFGSYGLPTVALRFSNVYGPYSYQKGSVVAVFFKRLLAGQPLTIYGDGSQTRDFLFVSDLCHAVVRAAEANCAGQVFHIASGIEMPIGELARRMSDIAGTDMPIEWKPARAGEVRRNCARIDRARSVLGFAPDTPLDTGLRATLQWFREH